MKTRQTLFVLALLLAACMPVQPSATPTPEPPTLSPTLTPAPTNTPVPPTDTPQPTATPELPLPFPDAQIISPENVGSLEQLSQYQSGAEIYDIAWSPDSRSMAFLKFDGLYVLDLATAQERQIKAATTVDFHSEIAFSPEGQLLAQSIVGGEIRLFNVQTGQLVQAIVGDGGGSFAFSPEGHSLISVGGRALKLWDVVSGHLIREFETSAPIDKLRMVAFAPNGRFVAASASGGRLFVWDVTSGAIKFQMTGNLFLARPLIFSPDSHLLAFGDGTLAALQLWSISDGQMTFGVNAQTLVNGIDFTRDGRIVASAGGAPNVIEFWSVEKRARIAQIELATPEFDLDFVEDITFSPDGRLFASAGGGGSGIVIWGVLLP